MGAYMKRLDEASLGVFGSFFLTVVVKLVETRKFRHQRFKNSFYRMTS